MKNSKTIIIQRSVLILFLYITSLAYIYIGECSTPSNNNDNDLNNTINNNDSTKTHQRLREDAQQQQQQEQEQQETDSIYDEKNNNKKNCKNWRLSIDDVTEDCMYDHKNNNYPGHGPFILPTHRPEIYKLNEIPDDTTKVEVLFALKQRNLSKAYDMLDDVSNPAGYNYGMYIPIEYWASNFSPDQKQIDEFIDYLESRFPKCEKIVARSKDFVVMHTTVGEVKRAWNVTVSYIHNGRGGYVIRLDHKVFFPVHIKDLVEFINLAAPVTNVNRRSHYKKDIPDKNESEKKGIVRDLHNKEYKSEELLNIFGGTAPMHCDENHGIMENCTYIDQIPEKRDLAPRINPVSVRAGDTVISMQFLPYCKDGQANKDTFSGSDKDDFPTADEAQDAVEDGNDKHPKYMSSVCRTTTDSTSDPIVSFEVVVRQPSSNITKVIQLPAEYPDVWGHTEKCTNGGVCTPLSTNIGGIDNFSKTWISIRAKFQSGETSALSPPHEVIPVWPLPLMTPRTLSRLYNMPINKPIRSDKNTVAVVEFLESYYRQKDLDMFLKLTGTPKQEPPVIRGFNSDNVEESGLEAQLDIQYVMAFAPNVRTIFYSVSGRNGHTYQEPFLQWLAYLSDSGDINLKDSHRLDLHEILPLINSISFGDDEDDWTTWYAARVNIEFVKNGLRGSTMIVASGDDGVAGPSARTDKKFCAKSRPMAPASLPYVTAVGGTQLSKFGSSLCGMYTRSGTSQTPLPLRCDEDFQIACMADQGGRITSGGGFSWLFRRPWYQIDHVDHFMNNLEQRLPPRNFFDPNNRAYPDISVYSSNYIVVDDSELVLVDGTSASAPVVVSMVAVWNDIRLTQSLPPLGFLNPLLYLLGRTDPDVFTDITVGNNRCTANMYQCCENGFFAQRGWDPVTGLGTPNVERISAIIRAMSYVQLGMPDPYMSGITKIMKTNNSTHNHHFTPSETHYNLLTFAMSFLLGLLVLGIIVRYLWNMYQSKQAAQNSMHQSAHASDQHIPNERLMYTSPDADSLLSGNPQRS